MTEYIEGLEGIPDEQDSKPKTPWIKIVQPTSDYDKLPEGARPGQLADNEGNLYTEMTVGLLKIKRGRQWYPIGTEGGPLCFSTNAKTPAENAKEKPAENCSTCPKSQWDDGKPECGEQYKIDFLHLTAEEPKHMVLFAKGTSIKPTTQLARYLVGLRIPPYRCECTIKTVKGQSGSFYLLDYGKVKVLDDGGYRDYYLELEGEMPF